MKNPGSGTGGVTVRAPTRIDLGGGWTDVPPYSDEQGGYVCNVAVDRYAIATVRDETYPASCTPTPTPDALVASVLRRTAARGVIAEVETRFPVGAGLGGSSAVSAALFGAVALRHGESPDRRAIAEAGRRVEVEDLGIAGGRQDHYAATFGGVLGLGFDRWGVQVRRLRVSPETLAAFERRSVLVYTGESRVSGRTIAAVMNAYSAGDRTVVSALARMKEIARLEAAAMERGDLDELGALVREHWVHQRSLHLTIPTPLIDEIIARAHRAGATGCKATGASGGGCVWVLAGDDSVEAVRAAVASLGEIVPFRVDLTGLTPV